MIYIEMQLSGSVQVYDLTDRLVLLRATIEARAECLPIPHTMAEALAYLAARCYQLEIFEDMDDARDWAAEYTGFRAGEVRAELARFAFRRAEYCPVANSVLVA